LSTVITQLVSLHELVPASGGAAVTPGPGSTASPHPQWRSVRTAGTFSSAPSLFRPQPPFIMTAQTRPAVRYVIRWKQATELLAVSVSALAWLAAAFWRG
jgi:hypothetical protein